MLFPNRTAAHTALRSLPTTYTIEEYAAHRLAWTEALCDPKNEQTTGSLVKLVMHSEMPGASVTVESEQFCCLGLAGKCAKLPYGPNTVEGVEPRGFLTLDRIGDTLSDTVDTANGSATREIMHWLGLRHSSGQFTNVFPGPCVSKCVGQDIWWAESLVDLNDKLGWTFRQIAAFVRTNPDGLWADGTF